MGCVCNAVVFRSVFSGGISRRGAFIQNRPDPMPQPPHAEFARRLHRALDASGFAAGRRRTGALSEYYGVSRETARKWLGGLALPELDRMIEIAIHHHVSFEWLATGRGVLKDSKLAVRDTPGKYGDPVEARLLGVLRKLSRKQQRALIDLLDTP